MSVSVADDMIRAFFERWQRLEAEKAAISDDLRELFAEMKGSGFDTKVARKVFRDKTVDQNERAEFEAIYDLYWSALSGPRAGRARERLVDHYASTANEAGSNVNENGRFAVSTTSEKHDAETGEITEPQRSPAAQSHTDATLSAPPADEHLSGTPSTGQGGDESPVTNSPETADETQATTPLPEDQGQRAAVSIAQEHRPAEANGLVKEPSEPEGSGGVQDRCESTPPSNSQSSGLHDGPLQAGSASALDKSGDSATGAEASVARILNTRCLKAQRGEFCKFADKAYSCSGCTQAYLQARARAA